MHPRAPTKIPRRAFLSTLAALAACARASKLPSPARTPIARRIAITMDDPHVQSTPLFSVERRDESIRRALRSRSTKAMLFVCGKRVDSDQGRRLLDAWNGEGHRLANHSYGHRFFHSKEMMVEDFALELEKGERVVAEFSGFRRFFRFPFLKEGETREKRDGARAVLRSHGYANGCVTIDTSDWAFDARLVSRCEREANVDLAPFRAAYLQHMLDRAHYYDALATRVLGRSIPHTLLVHHSLLNALFLGDLMDALVRDGWTLVDAEAALADPIFATQPDIVPAGESLVWACAKADPKFADTLRYPGEDDVYEKTTLDRLDPPKS